MKAVMWGLVSLGTTGGVAFLVGGGGGPDDFVATVNKPPEAVYAAFSSLGEEGSETLPTKDRAKVVQRVVKVPNEQVKLELTVDDQPLITAEVQMKPADGNGTRLAAEVEVNRKLLNQMMREDGAQPLPAFLMQDFMVDRVFARAMGEMVERIEQGKPLNSLAQTRERWGSESGPGQANPSMRASASGWQQRQASRPQLDARPALDPNQAARAHQGGGGWNSEDGW